MDEATRQEEIAEVKRLIEIEEVKAQIAAVEAAPQEFSFTQTAKNFPKSAVQLAKDAMLGGKSIIEDTARVAASAALGEDELYKPSLSRVASGAVQNMTGLGEKSNSESSQMASAVGDFYGDRYGTWDKTKQTIMNDPAGVMADASMVALPLSLASNTARVAGVAGLSRGLEKASKVAAAIDPMTAPTHLAKAVPKQTIYDHGFANLKGRDNADVNATSKFGFENEITPDDKGLAKARELMTDRVATRDEMLRGAAPITSQEIFTPALELGERRGSIRGSATPDVDADRIAKTMSEYGENLFREYPDGNIPAVEGNAMKMALYDAAADAYDKKLPASTEDTFKALARGAKEALETRAPSIGPVNTDMGNLTNIIETLDPGSLQKMDIPGIDFTARRVTQSDLAGVVVSVMRKRAADFALFLKQLAENPKANLAARQALVQAGRTEAEAEEELRRLIAEGLNDA